MAHDTQVLPSAVIREPLGPRQGSVWDYPRPPRVEPASRRIRVVVRGVPILDSRDGLRVLETAGAPVHDAPPRDVRTDLLRQRGHHTVCEYKVRAAYHDLVLDDERATRQPGRFYGGWVTSSIVGPFRSAPGTLGW